METLPGGTFRRSHAEATLAAGKKNRAVHRSTARGRRWRLSPVEHLGDRMRKPLSRSEKINQSSSPASCNCRGVAPRWKKIKHSRAKEPLRLKERITELPTGQLHKAEDGDSPR
uniref:Uncharacterized protein n=1 Tax=Cacopsylla melanoneura TaxID=428564 RepID=A0A8D9BQU3_9HEMI